MRSAGTNDPTSNRSDYSVCGASAARAMRAYTKRLYSSSARARAESASGDDNENPIHSIPSGLSILKTPRMLSCYAARMPCHAATPCTHVTHRATPAPAAAAPRGAAALKNVACFKRKRKVQRKQSENLKHRYVHLGLTQETLYRIHEDSALLLYQIAPGKEVESCQHD